MSQTAKNVAQFPVRRNLRTMTALCPAWSETEVTFREPTIRDYMDARKAADDQERTLVLLSRMLLDDKGNPVGLDAILAAPLVALNQLSPYVAMLLAEEEKADGPLT
jgi:hypothetical protein